MIAASFWSSHGSQVSAAITLVLTVIVAWLADHAFARREKVITETMIGERLSPVTETRLRLLRRLTVVVILVIGIAIALSHFSDIRRLATGLLASSAIAGVVIGFAARETLANTIAGLTLAFSQTIRVGDLITWEEHTGTVEDMRLTYTVVRLPDRSRLIVPNAHLASNEIANRTIVNPAGRMDVSMWVPLDKDQERVRRRVAEEAQAMAERHGLESTPKVTVAEIDKEGVRLAVSVQISDARDEASLAAELRERCLPAILA